MKNVTSFKWPQLVSAIWLLSKAVTKWNHHCAYDTNTIKTSKDVGWSHSVNDFLVATIHTAYLCIALDSVLKHLQLLPSGCQIQTRLWTLIHITLLLNINRELTSSRWQSNGRRPMAFLTFCHFKIDSIIKIFYLMIISKERKHMPYYNI